MNNLPFIVDAEEAIEFYFNNPQTTDAALAYLIGILKKDGYSNLGIRKALKIEKVYTVTHLTRAGILLSEDELMLWHSNPIRITLGHVRAVAKLPRSAREDLLRTLLHNKISVRKFEKLAKGEELNEDADIKRYEMLMSQVIGRQIKIKYNANKGSGSMVLDFFSLDDLDVLSKGLGFDSEAYL